MCQTNHLASVIHTVGQFSRTENSPTFNTFQHFLLIQHSLAESESDIFFLLSWKCLKVLRPPILNGKFHIQAALNGPHFVLDALDYLEITLQVKTNCLSCG